MKISEGEKKFAKNRNMPLQTDLTLLTGVWDDGSVSADVVRVQEAWWKDAGESRFDVLTLSLVIGTSCGIVSEYHYVLGGGGGGEEGRERLSL